MRIRVFVDVKKGCYTWAFVNQWHVTFMNNAPRESSDADEKRAAAAAGAARCGRWTGSKVSDKEGGKNQRSVIGFLLSRCMFLI